MKRVNLSYSGGVISTEIMGCNDELTSGCRSASLYKGYPWCVSHPSCKRIFVASWQMSKRSDMGKSTNDIVSPGANSSFVGKFVTHSCIVVPGEFVYKGDHMVLCLKEAICF